MAHDVETVIVGAGVVGLSIARELARKGHEVLILEQKNHFGSETSARNSEVIHAGIYYAKNSLKARLCTRGKALLYEYCDAHAIGFKRLGKIIVATSDQQVAALAEINNKARANGVHDLQSLSRDAITELEPAIDAKAGLLSPSTGILDSHGFMLSLLGNAESDGAMVAYNSSVIAITACHDGFKLSVSDEQTTQLSCKHLINAAGHGAPELARSLMNPNGNTVFNQNSNQVPQAGFAKGNYFRLQGKTPVSRLIYPVPVDGGLGVHITIDMAGQCRFGPDVEWQDTLNYDVDAERATHFYAAIRRYWPALEDNALVPDYAGIRPKIRFNEKPYNDFIIQGSQTHGIHGLVNLFGIESPGLTSSLAIAENVSSLLN